MAQDKPQILPKREIGGRDDREKGGNDQRRRDIAQQRKRGEILYRAAQLARNDRRSRSRRHNDTDHDALRENLRLLRRAMQRLTKVENGIINPYRQPQLHRQNGPMPCTQAQIDRIDLAKGEEKHEKNHPWQQRHKQAGNGITQCSQRHGQNQCIAIEECTKRTRFHYKRN